jgi:hypothetical protein
MRCNGAVRAQLGAPKIVASVHFMNLNGSSIPASD